MPNLSFPRVLFFFVISLLFLSCQKEKGNDKDTSSPSPPKPEEFKGYKVDPNAKALGMDYWKNLPIPAELYVGAFQRGVKILSGGPYASGKFEYSSWTYSVTLGDFNNDGWVDIFNAGAACNGRAANLTFLIWNPTMMVFEEKNLINDNTDYIGGNVRAISLYLNDDNYVDLITIGHNDECVQGLAEKCRIILSDGVGKYNISKLDLEPDFLHKMFFYEHGDVGDLNEDKIPDLVVSARHTYIFWGQKTFPYFSNKNFAHFAVDTLNFKTDNGFGEIAQSLGDAKISVVEDVNSDGKNDLILGTADPSPNILGRYAINQGLGRFNDNAIIKFPSLNYDNAEWNSTLTDDLNGDGRKDIIVNLVVYYPSGSQTLQRWELAALIQQPNGSFIYDKSWFQYTINADSRPNGKWSLFYFDINKDGKKDIGYRDDAVLPARHPVHDLKRKTVFLRDGNKFVEADFYQFDGYAKSIREKYFP